MALPFRLSPFLVQEKGRRGVGVVQELIKAEAAAKLSTANPTATKQKALPRTNEFLVMRTEIPDTTPMVNWGCFLFPTFIS